MVVPPGLTGQLPGHSVTAPPHTERGAVSNWNPRSLVIVVVIAASALVGCGGGSGGLSDVIVPADGRPANPDWAQLDPAMKDTLSAIAEQYGISREDARQRVGWQNAFAMAAGGIEAKYPNAFFAGRDYKSVACANRHLLQRTGPTRRCVDAGDRSA